MLLRYRYLSYVCTSVIAATIAAGVLQQVSAQTMSIQNREAAKDLSSAEVRQILRQVPSMPFYDEASDPDARPSYLEDSEEDVGTPGSAPGGRALSNRTGRESSSETEDEVEAETDFGTQNEGDWYLADQYQWLQTRYPWRAVGKLLIATTTPNVFNSSCSASVISGNNIIVTAAHCCYNRSAPVGFFKDWRFIPGAHNSSPTQPFSTYDWASTRVLNAWINSGGRQNDVCVIRLLPNSSGQGVSSRTGWLGRSWGQSQFEHVFTFGYPGNVGGGQEQAVCASENYPNCGSSLVNATGCNKTFGDSGAPWIRTYRPQQSGAMNFVNSVTSGFDSCTGTFGLSYNGARFTTSNIVPLCNAHGC